MRDLLLAALTLGAVVGASSAQASTILMIPYSSALPRDEPFVNCMHGFPTEYYGWSDCDLVVPIEVPVGHTISQVAVFHSAADYGGGIIEAWLDILTTQGQGLVEQQRFDWTATDVAPGYAELHRLMTRGDAFVVAPNTTYQVVVHLQYSEKFHGIQVTYD
jgi:hypothetical protein